MTGPDRIRILAALDAGGPGTTWIRTLRPDSETNLLAGRYLALHQRAIHRLYLGGGSALVTLNGYASETTAPLVTVEVPAESAARLRERWPGYLFLSVGDGAPGAAAQAWLKDVLGCGNLAHIDGALLLGHAQSIQRQRHALVTNGILDRRAISTKPYWATGREGL